MTPDECSKGARVRIARVTHAGLPAHDAMVGTLGTVRRFIKSRGVVEVATDSGKRWDALPVNLEPAP